MKLLDSLRFCIAALFQRTQVNAEMDEELCSHLQHRADDLERSSLDRAEAERRAGIEFGGQVRVKEEIHEAIGSKFIETLVPALILMSLPGLLATWVPAQRALSVDPLRLLREE